MVILKRNFKTRGIIIESAVAEPQEHVTSDLTVGDQYQIAGKPEWYLFEKTFTLFPGSCVLIRTRQRIKLPQDVFGILCSKGSLSAKGLIVSNTKVDPIFGDYLNIPMFNAGRRPIDIRPDMAFCSIYFQELEQKVPRDASRRAVVQQTSRRNAFRDYFTMNMGPLVGAALTSLVMIGTTTAIVLMNYDIAKSKHKDTVTSASPTPQPAIVSPPATSPTRTSTPTRP